ncbi:MAG: MFS transporter [Gemmatimonadales bacterium]
MNKGLGVLTATAFVDMLGFAIVFPLLPFFAKDLGASPFVIGILISSFSIAQLAMAPIWGRVSDHYGRRPVLLVALVASGIAFIVFGLAGSVWLLLLSRLVQGAGGGTTGVVQAYVADSTTPQDRAKALGWLSSATSAGVACGGAIGSLAVRFSHAAPGYLAAVLCFANVAFAWRYLEESRPKLGAPRRSIRTAAWHVLRHPFGPQPRLIWIYAVGMGAFAAMSSCVALYLNERFGVTEKTIGYVFLYITVLAVVMRALLLGRLVDRFGETRVMRTGALVFAIGLALYTVPATIPMFAVVLPLIPIGQALLFPAVTALSSHRSDPKEQGQMMGVQQAFGGGARVIGPIWAGAAFQGLGPTSPFLIAAVIMAVVGVLAFQVPIAAAVLEPTPAD